MKISYKAARVNAGLTLEQAAPLIGVCRDTLCSYENNKAMPKAATLDKMAEVYECPVENFKLPRRKEG